MITQYKCSYCSNVFNDEGMCKAHEEIHAKANDFTVTKVRYAREGFDSFPMFVELSTTDCDGATHVCIYNKGKNRSMK